MACEIMKINDQTWRFNEDNGVYFFLLTGNEYALLIDSGMEVNNAKELASEITKLPILHLITHADRDHLGSINEFETFYMHPAESVNYYKDNNNAVAFTPVEDGEIIDLGDRELEILLIPGHTTGSIAVLDPKYRALFSGDTVQNGEIFMFNAFSEINAFVYSLDKLKCYSDEFDIIYPSHAAFELKPEFIDELKNGALKMMGGKIEPQPGEFMGQKLKVFDVGAAKFLMRPDYQA